MIKGFQNPLIASILRISELESLELEGTHWRNSDLIIDAWNPYDVRVELQDYGVCINTSDGFIDGVTSVYKGEPRSIGTYQDGVIAFPTAKGMLCTINGDGYYFANQHGAFKLILPVDGANASTIAPANVNFGKDKKAAKSLIKAREDNFERCIINSVKTTVTMIAHKEKKECHEITKYEAMR